MSSTYVTSILKSKSLARSVPQPPVYYLQFNNMRQVHQNDFWTLTTNGFRDTKLKCTQRSQNDIKHLTVKSTPYTLGPYPWCPKFWSVSLYDQPFSKWDAENRKKSEMHNWPQIDHEHLTIKSTPHALGTYTRGPDFDPFRSTIQEIAHFIINRWLPG